MRQRLIIGCGNLDRGDDGAGILVARRLRELGVDAREHSGDGLSLLESWRGAEHVTIIDSVITGAPAGAIGEWSARTAPVQPEFPRSTHAFGLAEAIELARVLKRLPPSLTIIGIEGERFDAGTEVSPAVLESVGRVADRIAREVFFAGCGGQS